MKPVRMLAAAALVLALAACRDAPMPAPAPGEAPKEDSIAPADVSARDAAMPASAEEALDEDPQAELPLEPVAEDLGDPVVDGWAGGWEGPKGSSIWIAKQEVGYDLVITDSHGGTESYHGVGSDQELHFERDGADRSVRAVKGADTFVPELAGKRDCLMVERGEAWCRD